MRSRIEEVRLRGLEDGVYTVVIRGDSYCLSHLLALLISANVGSLLSSIAVNALIRLSQSQRTSHSAA